MPHRPKVSAADRVFGALANPTRREVLDLLLERPRAVGDIAEHFDMARPSVSEHLKVLRDAGLVDERREGRHRVFRIAPEPFAEVRDWLDPYERFWRENLRSMREHLDEQHPPERSA